MKQKLVYLLKHNPLIQRVYQYTMSVVFQTIGLFVPVDPDLVLFVSFMGTKYNDSPRAISEYLERDERYAHLHRVWALEKPQDFPALETVKIDTPRYFLTALRAKYWVTNTNIERGLHFKKKNQIYLNTWHGVALKTIGNDCPGRSDYDFGNINYMCVSGAHDERVFASAFRVKPESCLRCGMPRNDRLYRATAEEKQRLRLALGIPDGKKVILYAPTWRDSTDGGRSYALKPPIHFDAWKQELGADFVVLFRAHHMTTKVLNVQFNDFVRDCSDYPDINDLMIAADLLITDYSAVAFDYSILQRPILIFAYDYADYIAERGTYFDMAEVYPSEIYQDEEGLLNALRSLDLERASARTAAFSKQFMEHGGSATQACVEALFGEREEKRRRSE